MALTEQDTQLIEARAELMAERVVEKVTTRLLANHIASCPHGISMRIKKGTLIGLVLGAVAVGSGSGELVKAVVSLIIK
jgi:hypothetical protein